MAHIWRDFVLETSTTTGTGNLTLAGAVTGYRAFSAVCATSDTVYYFIQAVDSSGVPTGDWETGLGTYSASNTLTRTTVIDSSNSGSAVSFSAGTKRVGLCQAASLSQRPRTTPQGRLTLVSGTPVLTSDQTAKTAIYYALHVGDIVPIFNGYFWEDRVFSELTLTLDSTNHASGSLYDVFIWDNAGTISIGTGPAWSSSTSRGTGAGTTEIERKNGIWTNKNSITLKNGSGSGTSGIAANKALYVGTFYATANGQTGMAFLPAAAGGGTNNILGLYNAYNRVRVSALCRDNTASWSYTSATWRARNNNNSNRVSFVDGLQQSAVTAEAGSAMTTSSGNGAAVGVALDSTSATPQGSVQNFVNAATRGADSFAPSLGFHYVQALEQGATGVTFYGALNSQQQNYLRVAMEM